MDTGKVIKIHTDVPAPARPEPKEKPIYVPNWPIKEPVKVPEPAKG